MRTTKKFPTIETWILALCPLLMISSVPTPAMAGEIVNGIYATRHHGSLQIPVDPARWELKDQEAADNTSVATLSIKSSSGGTPVCDVTRAAGMATNIDQYALTELVAKGMSDAGMVLGPIKIDRIGGRSVGRFHAVLNRNNGSSVGEVYVLRGTSDYFVISCSAPAIAYAEAKPAFDELVAGMQY